MRSRVVAGNWKMHGSLAANRRLIGELKTGLRPAPGVSVAVCVPFPYLQQVGEALAGSAVALGAQTLSEHDSGAHTGEVSASMLKEFGCRYVIVGHSERRSLYAESDQAVAGKFRAAQAGGLIPILCLGETLGEREHGETEAVVARQLQAVLGAVGAGAAANAVIAYEPVWAIGTGRTATPEQAQEVHRFIRSRIADGDPRRAGEITILYGGSVKPGNAGELFAMPDIDGGLIGGASLVAQDFLAICRAADRS